MISSKQWVSSQCDKNSAKILADKYGLDSLLALLLLLRGYTTKEEIEQYLNCEQYEDANNFADMQQAVERINKALDNFENIVIYGDYDADGVTSTTVLYSYLLAQGANVSYYIPDRLNEGYGMNKEAVQNIVDNGAKLIITVDNGISAYDEIELCNSLGVDVIVTDHHAVPDVLPNAVAVVNPHRKDCPSKFKDYCGVGVVFKLICCLEGQGSEEHILSDYADLIALGTVADIVTLTGENRNFVKKGLEVISNCNRLGLIELINVAGLKDKKITTGDLGFKICPRINATGRLGQAQTAVKLLLNEDDNVEAEILAEQLNDANQERQDTEVKILQSAIEYIEQNDNILLDRVLVVEGKGWHSGVIGIVASRLTEKFGKPTFVITTNDDISVGSARSISGFSLYEAITYCSDLFVKYGGHAMAAGITLLPQNVDKFREKINEYAKTIGDMPTQKIKIDCNLNPATLSLDIVESISKLEPFGIGNSTPIFVLKKMKIAVISPISKGKHIKLTLNRNETIITAYLFNTEFSQFAYNIEDEIDVAVTLSENKYNGVSSLSIIVKDIHLSKIDYDKLLKNENLYQSFKRYEIEDSKILNDKVPTREDNALVYRFARENQGKPLQYDVVYYRFGGKINYFTMRICIDILEDVGLIEIEKNSNSFKFILKQTSQKVDLESSNILKRMKNSN